ncbi:polygalacturonase inhibitor-like [Silene latifolia]|uniref:polygalacturonase inhibitor-like n=1 Tax=Silene latifolia TaxID=37657 RepID=UPI003D77E526
MSPHKFYKHLLASLPLFSLLATLFVDLCHSQTVAKLCNHNDENTLLQIKSFWGNPPSLGYWDPNQDCCQWDLIQCNEQGRVITLRVSLSNDVHGPIPPFLDRLPSLDRLHFDNMYNLSGPIPQSIGKLTNLTAIVILGTNIGGPIPNFLGRLTNLVELNLASNKHTGPIPDFLGRLKSLTSLDLGDNQLTGHIPYSLTRLSNLSSLTLTLNKLSGSIPEFPPQKMSGLQFLGLNFNRFSGSIPRSLGRLPSLGALYLDHNKLTGDASYLFNKNNTVNKYISIGYNNLKFDLSKLDLPRLWGFEISHNLIYGSLPLSFGFLDPETVNVSYNRLCGPIPNGRRFKRANPDIFAHNKCLCGGPLPACK